MQFFKHKNYSPEYVVNDIGMVILKEDVTFTNRIQPIQMADKYDYLEDGDLVTALGWGYRVFEDKSSKPFDLHAVDLFYFDDDQCRALIPTQYANGMICASVSDFSKDACIVSINLLTICLPFYGYIRLSCFISRPIPVVLWFSITSWLEQFHGELIVQMVNIQVYTLPFHSSVTL